MIQVIEGIFHMHQAAGQRQQKVHHVVQVPSEHPELVKLVGLADIFGNGLHLVHKGTIGLHVLQEALPGFPKHLWLATDAVNELLLWGQRVACTHSSGLPRPSPLCRCCSPALSLTDLRGIQTNRVRVYFASNNRGFIRPGEGSQLLVTSLAFN